MDIQNYSRMDINAKYFENCVVCKKYLKTLYEQENGMCAKCDKQTDEIANNFKLLNK